MNESVSVIIPVFNRKDLVPFTLRSLDGALHPGMNLEIIVVDDGSTDGVIEWVTDNCKHVKVLKNTGKGAASARNTGLHIAGGKYVMYLDSDDIVGPGYFLNKIRYLNQNDKVDACYGEYDFFKSDDSFDVSKIIFRHKYPLLKGDKAAQQHLINNLRGQYLPPLAIIWRREYLQTLGGHDSSLPINQDVELLVRALFSGLYMQSLADGTFVYIREHSLDARVGAAGNSAEKLTGILNLRKRFYATLQQQGKAIPEFTRPLSEYLFNTWKAYRLTDTNTANQFLKLAKEIYWPVEVKGNSIFRLIGKIAGPENAVKWKYSIFRKQ